MTSNTTPILYGIWLPLKGWLKARYASTGKDEPVAFQHREVAERMARLMGGRVDYIDDTISALEDKLIEREKARMSHRVAEFAGRLLKSRNKNVLSR